ncbi:MAG: glutamate--cysteine ligase [Actinomycetota bacterium]|nr:glutamate--cysteine ligase [Actinomycetota bacterium]
MGVEEELLLVDARTGNVRSSADSVLRSDVDHRLTGELQQEQVETGSRPTTDLHDLYADICKLRREATQAAARTGTAIAALGTSPLPVSPQTTPHARYLTMVERFGLTASEQLACGCHVHVSVAGDDEAVAVLDRIRGWLPILLALSANSPYWQGKDTGYASFRSQAWLRWPSAGPTPVFGTPENYHRLVAQLIGSGTVLDDGMIYFDARLSANYSTVEVRTADVCRRPQDAVLMAALSRGLVETASREWAEGQPPDDVPTELLQVMSWRAARSGITGELVHPRTGRPHGATGVISAFLDYLKPVLSDLGDRGLVDELLADLLSRGNGAMAQRASFARTRDLRAVVLEAVADGSGTDPAPGSVLETRQDPGEA